VELSDEERIDEAVRKTLRALDNIGERETYSLDEIKEKHLD